MMPKHATRSSEARRPRSILPAVAALLCSACVLGGADADPAADTLAATVTGTIDDTVRSADTAAYAIAAGGSRVIVPGGAPVADETQLAIGGGLRIADSVRSATSTAARSLERAAVAPTPDELSALAASLVVPVAGVTAAELQGSFTAPRGGGSRQHNALDIPAPRGTPVIAATAGRVLRLFTSKAGGIMIYAADPTERFILMYAHLDRYAPGISEGMIIARGQTIGYVGTTGNAPPNVPHLHFAISRTNNVARWWNGTPVDPAPLFKR